MVATQEIRIPIPIDDIEIGDDRREVDREAVDRLAASIEKMGLQYEITVLKKNDEGRYRLVAGRHRIEAMRLLGRPGILAYIVDMTMEEARLWEISENLHRAELWRLVERDQQVAEWIASPGSLKAGKALRKISRGIRIIAPRSLVGDDASRVEADTKRTSRPGSLTMSVHRGRAASLRMRRHFSVSRPF